MIADFHPGFTEAYELWLEVPFKGATFGDTVIGSRIPGVHTEASHQKSEVDVSWQIWLGDSIVASGRSNGWADCYQSLGPDHPVTQRLLGRPLVREGLRYQLRIRVNRTAPTLSKLAAHVGVSRHPSMYEGLVVPFFATVLASAMSLLAGILLFRSGRLPA